MCHDMTENLSMYYFVVFGPSKLSQNSLDFLRYGLKCLNCKFIRVPSCCAFHISCAGPGRNRSI